MPAVVRRGTLPEMVISAITGGDAVQQQYLSNEEIVLAARRNLEQGPWDYLVGGAESETSMRRNRLGFDRLAFRPRVLVDAAAAFGTVPVISTATQPGPEETAAAAEGAKIFQLYVHGDMAWVRDLVARV